MRKSLVTVESISVCNANEKLIEHDIPSLPCSCINDAIYLFQKQLRRHRDIITRTTVGNSIPATITNLSCHLTYNSREAMLPEIHTMKKCDFLNFIVVTQITYVSAIQSGQGGLSGSALQRFVF